MTCEALVYSHSMTPRLQYIIDFLSRYYGLPFKLTPDEEAYIKSDSPCKINYSYHKIARDEIWVHPHALLFESAIHPVKIECFEHKDHKAFFKTEGDTGFDLFAATFYLISRYEEYLPHRKDKYGRYAHLNAVAFKEGFLQIPLVNIWLEDFKRLLIGKNAAFSHRHIAFAFLPTYDIDMAWSYRHKGFQRNAGAIAKLFFSGRWRSLSTRIKVLRDKITDPFDAYEWMDALHQQFGLHPIYFFLVASRRGKYDRNIDTGNAEFKKLVQEIAAKYKTGLHPSWASGDEPALLTKEKTCLEQWVNRTVTSSRQHFIRFELPSTYRNLLAAGITEDYSMGYGSINGFRASVASSYFWYDLKHEEQTQLLLHPFCFMDANSYYEQQLSAEEALQELLHYYNTIQSVNGTMITIWHNSFLGDGTEFDGWKEVYRQFISGIQTAIGH